MLNQIALSAVSRLNMSAIAVAAHHVSGMQGEIRNFLQADPEKMQAQFEGLKQSLCMAYGVGEARSSKPFAFANGLAIIPIHGMLINRFGGSWGFVTGYNFIRSQVSLAKNDPDVEGIIFDVNSYGGEVSGCQETADVIFSARGSKPTLAVVDAACYSAAYWTASAADKVIVTPSGGAGSIGAMRMHMDVSKALDSEGVTITLIHAGEHKVDGNPYEPLSDEVKASMQESVDEARDAFAESVAKNRGMSLQSVMETEARIYSAKEAKAIGLIDDIANPQEAVASYFNSLDNEGDNDFAKSHQEDSTMPDPTNDTPNQAATFTAADLAAARSEGATSERARISGIIGAEAAKGREALANHFAFNTAMDIESSLAALGVSPVAAAAPVPAVETTPENPFAKAMNGGDNPGIGAAAQEGADTENNESQASVDSFFAAREIVTGRKAAK